MTTPVDKGAVDISEEAFEGVRENLRDIMHLAEQGGWIESAAGEAIEFIHALRSALTASEKRRRETDMLAYKWMVAHDRLAAGLQYEFPSPANIPDALARVNELETFVRSVQVPTKDGTWKEVMFRLADEARVILAKGERS